MVIQEYVKSVRKYNLSSSQQAKENVLAEIHHNDII